MFIQDLEQLSQGINTLVGEHGVMLSGVGTKSIDREMFEND